jgi:Kef-type K+ transport system membrane component KefB
VQHIDITNLIVGAIAIAVSAGIPALFPRLPVPGVALEIIIGTIVGPQVLRWVQPGIAMDFLADLGLGMLFLAAGFEMDPYVLQGRPIRTAIAGWSLSAVLALAATLLVAAHAAASLSLTALAVDTTAIGVLMPMLRDDRLLGPPYGPLVLAGGAVGEAAPVVVLSLILAQGRAPLQSLIMAAFAAGAVAAVYAASRVREGYLADIVERTMGSSGQLPMRLTICVLVLLVVLSRDLDIDMVLGAFVAGAIVRSALHEQHRDGIALRLDGVGSAFLIPIFFITSGTRLDVISLFTSRPALVMVPVYAMLMLLVRGLPALLLYRAVLPKWQRLALALHLGTQISLVVPITSIAIKRGFMPGAQGAAMVGAAILTTLVFPSLAVRFLRLGAAAGGGPGPIR